MTIIHPLGDTCLTLVCVIFLLIAVVLPDQKLSFQRFRRIGTTKLEKIHQPQFRNALLISPNIRLKGFFEKMSHHGKNNLMMFSKSKLPLLFHSLRMMILWDCRASPSLSIRKFHSLHLPQLQPRHVLHVTCHAEQRMSQAPSAREAVRISVVNPCLGFLFFNHGFFGSDISLRAP